MPLPVSIVIPAHNCGEMFSQCLASVRSQSFRDFEVIVVNNGSTDGSAELAEQTAEEDSRFRVIHHPQGGAGTARNIGVYAAQGEYIAFVDGDDRLSEDYLEKLYQAACREKADIAVGGYCYYFLNSHSFREGTSLPEGVYDRDEALGLLLQDNRLKFYLWGKLFRRDLFTKYAVSIPDMYYEDAVSTPKLFYYANRVVSVDFCGYYYTRAFSRYTEVQMTADRVNDYVNTIPMIRLFLEEHGCYPDFWRSFRHHVFHVYFAIPSMVRQSAGGNVQTSRENIRRAKAKVRLCLRRSPEVLKRLDLNKPVVE